MHLINNNNNNRELKMEFANEMCRVCLQDGLQCNSLFDEVEYDVCIPLADIFRKVTNIEINYSGECKPLNLCNQCTECLLSAYEFICKVEKSEKDIDIFLNEHTIEILEDEQNIITKIESLDASDTEIQDLEILEDEFETIKQENDESQPALNYSEQADIEVDDDNSTTQEKSAVAEVKNTKPAIGSRLGKRLASGLYKCESCYRSFAKLETLARHKQNAHTYLPLEQLAAIAPQATAPDTDKKRIPCPHCPRDFVRRDNYVRHLLTSHPDKADLTPEDRQLAKFKHKYKKCLCPHCGESFSQGSLIIHIRRHTGENPYKCNECLKGFPRRQDLVLHQRQHTGERPHVCTVCGKTFTRSNKLARHMRIHTGERPYKCTKCSRSFIQSNDLKIHMRRHTGEKPYKCKVCPEAFICGAALKAHRRTKNHHLPGDEEDDPLVNWRVSTRKTKTFSKRKNYILSSEERIAQHAIDDNTMQSIEEGGIDADYNDV